MFLEQYEQYDKEPFADCENSDVPMGKWLLEKLPKKPLNILDVGCGTGVHTKWFNEQDIACTGITINPNEIDERVHPNVQYGDMLDIPYPDKSFECVFCLGALEHTHIPFIALCEFNRVLKDKGYLFVDMVGIGGLSIVDDRFFYHKMVLFPIQMKDLLLRTNFELVYDGSEENMTKRLYSTPIVGGTNYLALKIRDMVL
jgi:ubiquinone/menaquinone biosynthesis C-methylase UbiE